ncbi:unnamed protein product [Arctia plantaginis]|uniref:Uncharacterized protein n=1 Tax=Arctia plantaginis TaxID=874455 RepID=A0A8S0YWA7_ARCPL|nr:unnamed protein product [Arctia plantaginis]
MSASKKDESKTKSTVDESVDSGFLSGPLDHWAGDEDPEQSKDEKVLCGESGVIVCDTLVECLADVKLGDAELVRPQTEQIRCTVTSPEEKVIPASHLAIFFEPDDDGDTQLHIASIHGCEKSVGTLIKICPNKELLDITNEHGHTPLHLAVMSGNAVVTRMLVRAGLSLGVRDRTGETPLHKATAAGHVECLQALLAPVPDQQPRKLDFALNQRNYRGQACVHVAASSGHLEVLQTLVYYKADINAREHLAGWTALHIASRRGDVRMVQFLRERCAGVVVDAKDFAGRTARRIAKRTPAARLFANDDGSDEESDSDDDMYDSDSDGESLFERLRESLGPSTSINVA